MNTREEKYLPRWLVGASSEVIVRDVSSQIPDLFPASDMPQNESVHCLGDAGDSGDYDADENKYRAHESDISATEQVGDCSNE